MVVKDIVTRALYERSGCVGQNITSMISKFNLTTQELKTMKGNACDKLDKLYIQPEERSAMGKLVQELLSIRDQQLQLSEFYRDEIVFMIESICIV